MKAFLLIVSTLLLSLSHAFVTPVGRSAAVAFSKQHQQQQHHQHSSPFHQQQQQQHQPQQQHQQRSTLLAMNAQTNLPFWLDPGTKGGAVVLSLLLFIVPIMGYFVVTSVFGVDGIEAGKWIGIGFTVISTFLWVGTYIFRVATKDMTYAKQLKDYENAVIAKRLEELDEDEIQALVEEIERDEF